MTVSERIEIRFDLPREALAAEHEAAGPDYVLGPEASLPPDPGATEARFVEPVTLIATITVAMLVTRIAGVLIARAGRGVLIDARKKPPTVSRLADIPAGFLVIIHPDGKTETKSADEADRSVLTGLIQTVLGRAG
jgi:hypothetical protein